MTIFDSIILKIANFILLFRCDRYDGEVTIALVGKYVKIEDAYASVNKALGHAAVFAKRKLVLKVANLTLPILFEVI